MYAIRSYYEFPPTRNECIASALAPDNLAPNSDLYLCLQTSEGSYGFFVEREFLLDLNRFTFDLRNNFV